MAEITPAGPGYDDEPVPLPKPKPSRASDSGWGKTTGVPLPTSSYGADFSADHKMTPDFTLDLKAEDWKSHK